jgi:serine/threonine-protein kinase
LTALDPDRNEIHHAFPQVLDGGRTVLFTAMARSKDAPHSVELFEVATRTRRTLIPGAQYARYLATGHVVYARERTLYAMKVAPGTLSPLGPPVAVVSNLQTGSAGHALFSVSADGTLVYAEVTSPPDRRLVWVTRAGLVTETGLPPGAYDFPRLSREGLVAVVIRDGDNNDIWAAPTGGGGTLDRLTFGRRTIFTFEDFAFSPDGARLAYSEDADGGPSVVIQPVDRSGGKETVLTWPMSISPSRWLPDGRLLLHARSATMGVDLLVSDPRIGGATETITDEPGYQFGALPSPDGRYLVYASSETGRREVFVRAYPGPPEKQQITTEGGTEPVWSIDGREIYYRSGNRMMAMPVTTRPSFGRRRPITLFEGAFVQGSTGLPAYDVAKDGRFLMMRSVAGSDLDPRQLHVVLNWFDELNERLARGK